MFNQGTKMFVWEKGGVQSPFYLQYLRVMVPEQLSLVHSKGMRLHWTRPAKAKHCMVEAKRATPALGDGEQDRNQAGSGGWIKSSTLNPSTSRKPPLTLIPTSLCYDNCFLDGSLPKEHLFLEQILQQLFLGFYNKQTKFRNNWNWF